MYTHINIYNMIKSYFFNFVLDGCIFAPGWPLRHSSKKEVEEKKRQVPPLNDQSYSAAV